MPSFGILTGQLIKSFNSHHELKTYQEMGHSSCKEVGCKETCGIPWCRPCLSLKSNSFLLSHGLVFKCCSQCLNIFVLDIWSLWVNVSYWVFLQQCFFNFWDFFTLVLHNNVLLCFLVYFWSLLQTGVWLPFGVKQVCLPCKQLLLCVTRFHVLVWNVVVEDNENHV